MDRDRSDPTSLTTFPKPADGRIRIADLSSEQRLALHVADAEVAERFYVDVLGCRRVERSPELTSGALRIDLLRDPEATHDRAVPSFDVADRSAALTALEAAGCTLIPIGPHAPGEMYVQDPFGVVFDVIARPGYGSATSGIRSARRNGIRIADRLTPRPIPVRRDPHSQLLALPRAGLHKESS